MKQSVFSRRVSLTALLVALTLLFPVLLAGCGMIKGGDVSAVVVTQVPSEIYSEKDIGSAISVIKREFSLTWSGCTLREIGYAGDERNRLESDDYLNRLHGDFVESWGKFDQVLILVSSFDVDGSGGDGSFTPNSTCTDWDWILVREGKGPWRHVDHGYH